MWPASRSMKSPATRVKVFSALVVSSSTRTLDPKPTRSAGMSSTSIFESSDMRHARCPIRACTNCCRSSAALYSAFSRRSPSSTALLIRSGSSTLSSRVSASTSSEMRALMSSSMTLRSVARSPKGNPGEGAREPAGRIPTSRARGGAAITASYSGGVVDYQPRARGEPPGAGEELPHPGDGLHHRRLVAPRHVDVSDPCGPGAAPCRRCGGACRGRRPRRAGRGSRPMTLTIAAGPGTRGARTGIPVTARTWFSNWLTSAPSSVQCPELWTRGAISLARRRPPSWKSSMARTPT